MLIKKIVHLISALNTNQEISTMNANQGIHRFNFNTE